MYVESKTQSRDVTEAGSGRTMKLGEPGVPLEHTVCIKTILLDRYIFIPANTKMSKILSGEVHNPN